MIKLSDILKEINIRQKTQLGSGDNVEGEVYPFELSPDKVIKKYTQTNPEIKYAQYELMKKYPKFFVEVFKVTPQYVVLEKVKTPIPGLKELQRYINNELGIKFVRGGEVLQNVYANDLVIGLFNELSSGNLSFFNFILKQVKEAGKTDYYNLLTKLYIFFKNFKKEVPEGFMDDQYLDIHSDNIGINKQGKLKLFDINYTDPNDLI
jgi:hypothetical protein